MIGRIYVGDPLTLLKLFASWFREEYFFSYSQYQYIWELYLAMATTVPICSALSLYAASPPPLRPSLLPPPHPTDNSSLNI